VLCSAIWNPTATTELNEQKLPDLHASEYPTRYHKCASAVLAGSLAIEQPEAIILAASAAWLLIWLRFYNKAASLQVSLTSFSTGNESCVDVLS